VIKKTWKLYHQPISQEYLKRTGGGRDSSVVAHRHRGLGFEPQHRRKKPHNQKKKKKKTTKKQLQERKLVVPNAREGK
jgi:hypothetical protein